ncbi:MAG TPA: hypothetical protein VH062_03195 [Polyangiaceae bacterium]|nr:hypothetical protein [Polyangiaceae bacterium]
MTTDGARALPADLAGFLESGISILVGTRDARLRPSTLRAMGASVERDARVITLYMPEATSARTLANLRDNGQIAATFSLALDHRTIQIKGTCFEIRRSGAREREAQERYRERFIEALQMIGMPRFVTERATYWPSLAVQ